MPNAPNKRGFELITSRNLTITNAPAQITLPQEAVVGMQYAWHKSFPKGKSQEQGGILVRRRDRSYKWKAGKAGRSDAFRVNYEDVGRYEILLITGHTHPYDKSEGGHTDISFSATDLANLVIGKEPAKVVQSGQSLFLVAQTREFNHLLQNLSIKGKQKLHTEIKKTWYNAVRISQGNDFERIDAAILAVCHKYHFIYYKGKGNLLKKVDISNQNNKDIS